MNLGYRFVSRRGIFSQKVVSTFADHALEACSHRSDCCRHPGGRSVEVILKPLR